MSKTLEQAEEPPEGYQEAQIGPETLYIPQEWDVIRLGDDNYTQRTMGGTPDTSVEEYWNGEIPWMRSGDIHQRYVSAVEGRITEKGKENSTAEVIPKHSVLIGLNGQGKTKGTVAINEIPLTANQSVGAYIVNDEMLDYRYLYFSLDKKYSRLRALAGGGRSGLNLTLLGQVKIPHPPLREQRRIADILSTVDKYLEETTQMIEKYQDLRKGFLQDALSQGLKKSATHQIEVPISPRKWTVPKGWEIKTISEITTELTDGVHQTPTYVEEGVPFLKAGDLREDSYNWEQFPQISQEAFNSQRFTAKRGDVLLAKNGSPKTIGVTKVVDWDTEFSFFVSICLLRPELDQITPKYLQAALMSEIAKNQMANMSQTGTVTNLHLEEIRSISIPIPPLSEQKEIVERWEKIEDRISQEKETKDQIENLKRGLMQDLLTGKVRTNTD